jgi:hypothetical protein
MLSKKFDSMDTVTDSKEGVVSRYQWTKLHALPLSVLYNVQLHHFDPVSKITMLFCGSVKMNVLYYFHLRNKSNYHIVFV